MCITKNYACDVELLRVRSIKHGFSPIDIWFDIDYGGDHSPSISIGLTILNIKLIDFSFYNIHHEEDDDA